MTPGGTEKSRFSLLEIGLKYRVKKRLPNDSIVDNKPCGLDPETQSPDSVRSFFI